MTSCAEYVKEVNKDLMARFVLDNIPGGDSQSAINFLDGVIESIKNFSPNKKAKVDDVPTVTANNATKKITAVVTTKDPSSAKAVTTKDPFTAFYVMDEIDHIVITLALQFPNDTHLTSYIIGPKGSNVLSIGKKTGTRIKVENEGTRENDQLRHVFIMGPLKGTIRAYHMLHDHICLKAHAFPIGSTERTFLIIPNEIISRIIGKAGRFIKDLSTRSKVHRIELQKDRDLFSQYGGYYGRYADIVGDFANRLHAVYLLLRLMATDVELPQPYFGDLLPVLYPPRNPSNGPHGPFHDGPPNMGPHGMMSDFEHGHFPPHNGGQGFGRMGPGGLGPGMGMGMGSDRGFGGQINHGGQGAHGGGGGFGPNFGMDSAMNVDIQVPSDKSCVGYIYGPKGSAIMEMEQLSKCRIVFDKEPVPGSLEDRRTERKVTVSGQNAAQTSRAVELIHLRILDWRRTLLQNSVHSTLQTGHNNVQNSVQNSVQNNVQSNVQNSVQSAIVPIGQQKRDRNDIPIGAAVVNRNQGQQSYSQQSIPHTLSHTQHTQAQAHTSANTQLSQHTQQQAYTPTLQQQQQQGVSYLQSTQTQPLLGSGQGGNQGMGGNLGVRSGESQGQIQGQSQAQSLQQQQLQYSQSFYSFPAGDGSNQAHTQGQGQGQIQGQVHGQGVVHGQGLGQGQVQGQGVGHGQGLGQGQVQGQGVGHGQGLGQGQVQGQGVGQGQGEYPTHHQGGYPGQQGGYRAQGY